MRQPLLCPFHHHLVHDCGWTIRGNPQGEVEFVRPGGRPLGDAGDFLKRIRDAYGPDWPFPRE